MDMIQESIFARDRAKTMWREFGDTPESAERRHRSPTLPEANAKVLECSYFVSFSLARA